MPYKSEAIKIQGTKYDARRRITDKMRAEILGEEGKLSQRVTARKYGVSRRSVVFIWFPERLARSKELFKIRRLDGRYYNKKKHTKAIKRLRSKKQDLYVKGIIKLKQ